MSFRLLRLNCVSGFLPSLKNNKCIFNSKVINIQFQSVSRNSNLVSEVSKPELLKNIKTAPEKDKILFYYENPRFFVFLNAFGFVQFFFWLHMSEFTFKKFKKVDDVDQRDSIETQKNPAFWGKILDFQDDATRKSITALCFFMGYLCMAICWMYTLRTVRLLVLRKGGKSVSIVTYAPLGKTRTIDVPLEKLSTSLSREACKSQLPIKVQGKWFYYLLDTRSGVFHNPVLFDYTAGMKRNLTK